MRFGVLPGNATGTNPIARHVEPLASTQSLPMCAFHLRQVTVLLLVVLVVHGALIARADGTSTPAENKPLTLAVFDFQAGNGSVDSQGAEIAALLGVHLSAVPSVSLVDRAYTDKILAEHTLTISGSVTPENAPHIGALLGAKVLVTGRKFNSGRQVLLVAKIIGTETGRVFAEQATAATSEHLNATARELAQRIVDVVNANSDSLEARRETDSQRIERLRGIVHGRKLPVVSVAIDESHHGSTVPESAAQTALVNLLRQVGFEVVDPAQHANRGGITISGKAFSEAGMRRGSLISCRARVEITVEDVNGSVLVADHETDAGVDIAELVAGKNALRNAATRLGERIVSKLAAVTEP